MEAGVSVKDGTMPEAGDQRPLISWRGLTALLFIVLLGLIGVRVFAWALGGFGEAAGR